ncbi:MAG: chemotaxis protein CheW [Gomphosphaeria aponina SAG 52.96 = DSM 107014]|uniref:Chemotaxis protein CheW n=1 Tax=Gomphosphaeria aponina SAG 52.96 = DSM 107014 TaxID=1521640 RepID=A0A941GM42_9CHRO|nr:chemotaxis protein CheW [Gomphosphaeria aponina SAG 52.96 = DSM 107014]
MAIFSPLRSRRLASRQTEATKQLIAFRLRQEWFALPIEVVEKVVPLGNVYGDPKQKGVGLTLYQGKEILVVDVGKRIFKESSSQIKLAQEIETRFLVLVRINDAELVGLPIDSSPSIRRVPESSLTDLPAGYVKTGNIQCVSSVIIEVDNEEPLFLLNHQQLHSPENIRVDS